MNVSRRLVQDAVKLIDDGVPELQVAVDSGTLTVTAALTVLDLAPNKQRAMVGQSLREPKPAKAFAKAVRAEENDSASPSDYRQCPPPRPKGQAILFFTGRQPLARRYRSRKKKSLPSTVDPKALRLQAG